MGLILEVIRDYRRYDLFTKAAALSFFTLISLFPLLLLIVVVTQALWPIRELQVLVEHFLQQSLPYKSSLIHGNIKSFFSHTPQMSWLGFFTLVLSAQMLYVNVEKAVNELLHCPVKRHFLATRLFFLLWILSSMLLLLMPLFFELAVSQMQKLGWSIHLGGAGSRFILFFFASLLVFVLLMYILPTHRPKFKPLLMIASMFSIGLFAVKLIFTYFTQFQLNRYHTVYGSLSIFILILLWIFFFYQVFLFSVYLLGRRSEYFEPELI